LGGSEYVVFGDEGTAAVGHDLAVPYGHHHRLPREGTSGGDVAADDAVMGHSAHPLNNNLFIQIRS